MKGVAIDAVPEAQRAIDEIYRLRGSHAYAALCRSIDQKKTLLAQNPICGTKIAHDRIPKIYVEKYQIDNLWKIDLSQHWRMLYTLKTNEIVILALILDVLNHPTYDKRFGYRKK